jgi:hypothetical protein
MTTTPTYIDETTYGILSGARIKRTARRQASRVKKPDYSKAKNPMIREDKKLQRGF